MTEVRPPQQNEVPIVLAARRNSGAMTVVRPAQVPAVACPTPNSCDDAPKSGTCGVVSPVAAELKVA